MYEDVYNLGSHLGKRDESTGFLLYLLYEHLLILMSVNFASITSQHGILI